MEKMLSEYIILTMKYKRLKVKSKMEELRFSLALFVVHSVAMSQKSSPFLIFHLIHPKAPVQIVMDLVLSSISQKILP